MMTRQLLILTSFLLSACTAIQPRTLPQASPYSPTPLMHKACSNLLDDYEAFSLMDEKRRKRYLKDTFKSLPLAHDACEQLRMALLLSQPDRSDRDRQKALKLLGELLDQEKPLDPQAQQLARLLHDQLSKTRAEQLKALELRHRLKAQRIASRQLSEQLNNLQSQLQQLKNIEQDINEKEKSIITPSTGNLPSESPQDSTGR